MSGIYIHIPFCVSKCAYCNFYSLASKAKTDDYVETLKKEIAVRKTFGGTKNTEIWRNLKTFIRITLIANLIAIPLAAVSFSTIMKYSADKVTNIWIIYAACAVISFAITIGSVLIQVLRAARTNPAEALKKE